MGSHRLREVRSYFFRWQRLFVRRGNISSCCVFNSCIITRDEIETELLSKQNRYRISRKFEAGSVTNHRKTGVLNLSKHGPTFEPIADPRGDELRVSFRE